MNQKDGLRNFLEQAYGQDISDAELKEKKEKLMKFFEILIEIDMKQRKK